jgi:hypothetical protein
MAANTLPIYPLTPKIAWGGINTANTAKDGINTVVTVFTAGANGSRVDKLTVTSSGTAVQTVLRVFLNNGSANSTPSNNALYAELFIPATVLSETTEQQMIVLPLDIALPAGYKINVTIGTSVAAALAVTVEGGDF